MDDITRKLLDLRTILAKSGGEILSITLNKAGKSAIIDECVRFCGQTPIDICPNCGGITTDDMIFGIRILAVDK